MKEVPATPPLATLLAQQREHWQLGERIPVETYLLRHPSLTDDADVVLDLIGNELLLRLELGERPLLAEFVQRFPQWSAEIKIQITNPDCSLRFPVLSVGHPCPVIRARVARSGTSRSGSAEAALAAPDPGRGDGRFTQTVEIPRDFAGTTS